MLSDVSQSQKHNYLYEISNIVKLIEAESIMVVSRVWGGRGEGPMLFGGYSVSIIQDEIKF